MNTIPGPEAEETRADYVSRCLDCLKSEKIPEKHKLIICVSKYINASDRS